MFNALINRLRGHGEKPLPALDARLAVGALLVRLAKSDDHYAFEEIVAIDHVLASRYGLGPVEAMKMRADCERLAAEIADIEEFATLVHDAVPYDERLGLMESLWQLSLADRKLTAEEESMLGELGEGLGIEPGDCDEIAGRYRV